MQKQKELVAEYERLLAGHSQKASAIGEEGQTFEANLKKHKISQAEYATLKTIVGRTPTLCELGVFSAMWSEHCSYKSSKVHLRKLPTEGPDVVVGPGENAGVVRLDHKLCAAFKMESHNHPSYIEPYQGAATGVGGILRDVFCMGSRPVANLNSLRFGARAHPRTHYLFENVVKGVGDYGNCVGIPTIAGSVSFDKTYNGNILVNAMTVGLIHEDKIFKGYASGIHNLVVYVGSATGRDGIHGASMASDSFSTQQSGERSTVQVGDPFAEKLLLEATLEVLERGLVVGLQDMGAAGLTSSSFEMADRAGNGLYLNLDYVPTRAQAMSAYELLLSESQERMLMCVEPKKWAELKSCLEKWQLPFAIIGIVTDSGRMNIVKSGVLEVDVPVGPLAEEAPRYERPFTLPKLTFQKDHALRTALQQKPLQYWMSLALEEDGDKAVIYRQYDHHIGNRTKLGPESQGAGLLWLRSPWQKNPYLGLAVTTACNELYTAQDPHWGAAHAVAKCYRSIAATGAKPLAITDCLNYGNPEVPEVMGQIVAGIEGIGAACRGLDTPVVSGNVSLYNTTDGQSIAPTPMIGMIGKHEDMRKAVGAVLETAEADLYWVRPKTAEPSCGGSLMAKLNGKASTEALPVLDCSIEKAAADYVRSLIFSDQVLAVRDIGKGGLLLTLIKMLLPKGLGARIDLGSSLSKEDFYLLALGEWSSSYIVAARRNFTPEAFANDYIYLTKIGSSQSGPELRCGDQIIDLGELLNQSESSLKI